ncbi:MAG: amidase [Planctomycetota bacterium]
MTFAPRTLLSLLAALPALAAPARPYAQEAAPAARPALTVADVGAAGRVIGLDFTPEELALMLPSVAETLAEFEGLRGPSLANAVPPATTFAPFLPGMERRARLPAPEQRGPRGGGRRAPKRPAQLEDVAFWPLADLAYLVKHRLVSCVELTEMYLGRLERLDATLHCVISFTRERALAQAAARDAELAEGRYRGVLHGLPWGVKDLFSVPGYPTTWGAKAYEHQQLEATATVVQRLDDAGAILIAKLSVGALAMGDVWFGERTRSPWNPERGSSGSSAGSASATAAGGVAFAIGTETLGSLVSPSVVCATSTLRPTFGRVSRSGAMALSWTMDKVGPITRYVDDLAYVFLALEGRDVQDPFSRDRRALSAQRREQLQADLAAAAAPDAGLRKADGGDVVAWLVDWPYGRRIGVVTGGFERNDEVAVVVDELRALGHTIVDVTLPTFPVGDMLITLTAEAATAFDELTRSGQDDLLVQQGANAWPNIFRAARLIPAVEYLRAQRLRWLLMHELHAALADVDLVVHAPFAAGLLQMTNLTGHPTIVAPYVGAGGPRRDGSPRSVCFTGQLDGDELLLGVVAEWQAAHPEHVLHPPLTWLQGDAASAVEEVK